LISGFLVECSPLSQAMHTGNARQTLLAAGSILAIVISVLLMVSQSRQPKFNVALQEGLGQAIAEETARLLNNTGAVVLVTLNSPLSHSPGPADLHGQGKAVS
jgi:hypothetical protein